MKETCLNWMILVMDYVFVLSAISLKKTTCPKLSDLDMCYVMWALWWWLSFITIFQTKLQIPSKLTTIWVGVSQSQALRNLGVFLFTILLILLCCGPTRGRQSGRAFSLSLSLSLSLFVSRLFPISKAWWYGAHSI